MEKPILSIAIRWTECATYHSLHCRLFSSHKVSETSDSHTDCEMKWSLQTLILARYLILHLQTRSPQPVSQNTIYYWAAFNYTIILSSANSLSIMDYVLRCGARRNDSSLKDGHFPKKAAGFSFQSLFPFSSIIDIHL